MYYVHTHKLQANLKQLKYTRWYTRLFVYVNGATNAPTAPSLIDFNVCVHLNGSHCWLLRFDTKISQIILYLNHTVREHTYMHRAYIFDGWIFKYLNVYVYWPRDVYAVFLCSLNCRMYLKTCSIQFFHVMHAHLHVYHNMKCRTSIGVDEK